ncbi:MAG: exodeoxyribonuclease VII large subunit [Candidatus Acididesulfobacter diazotrophicus]|jgi:exodeoxyribonuclease VII large subunit|uniref:Exodeoxyribonuclease 7 large subunit n=1 Tax=Candidatus Acididesulfobacter diazotrophicus TaxID=2597226 RepID=A0A519BNN4_9DELT|nr:MAG: exodeoxyribonuclease VII large subunit [Candidatus Acididesulfobacter diazotrophicus]
MMENYFNSDKIIYSVSELTLLIKETVETKFYSLWVKGEISGFKSGYASGYYFDLKDSKAKISSIIFKYDIQRLKFEIKEGMSVIAFGRINLYEPKGTYSFIISEIEPEGYGRLALAYEQLKEKLQNAGLFDKNHKRNIPFLPHIVGIVTSKNGAVLHDIVKIIRKRFGNIHLIFANASVQGINSSAEIANAIRLLNEYSKNYHKIDVLIVGRGGGSLEDLWSFNEEKTAYAIYNSEIPIISAVGHETDFTIADFVADVRASTPSNAAEISVPVKSDIINAIKIFNGRLKVAVLNIIKNKNKAIEYLQGRQYNKNPKKIIEEKLLLIDDITNDIFHAANTNINNFKNIVNSLNKRLELRHPSHILKDKYSRFAEIQTRLKLRHPRNIIKDYKILIEKTDKILNDIIIRKIGVLKTPVDNLGSNINKAIYYHLIINKQNVNNISNRLNIYNPLSVIKLNQKNLFSDNIQMTGLIIAKIKKNKQILENNLKLLNEAMKNKIFINKNNIKLLNNTLESISPYSVLKRGYSIAFNEKDEIISSISDVNTNDKIKIIVSDGLISSIVLSKDKKNKK